MPRRYFIKMEREKDILTLNGEMAHRGFIYVQNCLPFIRKSVEPMTRLGYFSPQGKYCANIEKAKKKPKKGYDNFISSKNTGEAIFFSFNSECHWTIYLCWTDVYDLANCRMQESTEIISTKKIEASYEKPCMLMCFTEAFTLYILHPLLLLKPEVDKHFEQEKQSTKQMTEDVKQGSEPLEDYEIDINMIGEIIAEETATWICNCDLLENHRCFYCELA